MRKSSTAVDGRQEEVNPWRESLEARLRERMRQLIEQVLEEEVEEALGAARSQRVAERCGYRHGAKPRRLVLRGGAVHVAVPRARQVDPEGSEREWQSQLLPRYRRTTPEVEQAVLGVYLSGGNTRRIRGALSPLLTHAPLSKSAVSRLVARLEESYQAWQQRDLSAEKVVYLYLDAIYLKVRSGGKVVSVPVLVALGVKATGEKILLSLATAGADAGSAQVWRKPGVRDFEVEVAIRADVDDLEVANRVRVGLAALPAECHRRQVLVRQPHASARHRQALVVHHQAFQLGSFLEGKIDRTNNLARL